MKNYKTIQVWKYVRSIDDVLINIAMNILYLIDMKCILVQCLIIIQMKIGKAEANALILVYYQYSIVNLIITFMKGNLVL